MKNITIKLFAILSLCTSASVLAAPAQSYKCHVSMGPRLNLSDSFTVNSGPDTNAVPAPFSIVGTPFRGQVGVMVWPTGKVQYYFELSNVSPHGVLAASAITEKLQKKIEVINQVSDANGSASTFILECKAI